MRNLGADVWVGRCGSGDWDWRERLGESGWKMIESRKFWRSAGARSKWEVTFWKLFAYEFDFEVCFSVEKNKDFKNSSNTVKQKIISIQTSVCLWLSVLLTCSTQLLNAQVQANCLTSAMAACQRRLFLTCCWIVCGRATQVFSVFPVKLS